MSLKKDLSWIIFGLFAAIAVFFHNGEPLFISQSPYAVGKIFTWNYVFWFFGLFLLLQYERKYLQNH